MSRGPSLLVAAGPPESPEMFSVTHDARMLDAGTFEIETPTARTRVEPPMIVDRILERVTAGDGAVGHTPMVHGTGPTLLLVIAQEGTRLARSCAFYRDHGHWVGLDDAQPRDEDDVRAALLCSLTSLVERTVTVGTLESAA